VTARVAAGRERVVADHAGATVLVVTHVTPIKSLVRLTLGAPADAVFRMQLAPASFSRIDHYEDGNVALRGFAVDSHLR
jgi:probable phosphoglycerate mutase